MSRRTALAALGVAAALLLAACSPMVEEVSPISSVSLPVSAAPSPSPSLALEFAGQFGHYNDSLDPHDFTILSLIHIFLWGRRYCGQGCGEYHSQCLPAG